MYRPKDVRHFEGMYRIMQSYDMAPTLAKLLFSHIKDDIPKINAEFQKEYNATDDTDRKTNIGHAFNYASLKAYFAAGKREEVDYILDELAKKDQCYLELEKGLRKLGTSFKELCLKQGELLTPSNLDKAVFEMYAPQCRELYNSYLENQGFAVVNESNGWDVILIYQRTGGREIIDDKRMFASDQSFSGICHKDFHFESGDINILVEECLQMHKVKSSSVIHAADLNISDYLRTRFEIVKIGRFLQANYPGRVPLITEIL